jgi:hypothetical protein
MIEKISLRQGETLDFIFARKPGNGAQFRKYISRMSRTSDLLTAMAMAYIEVVKWRQNFEGN